MEYGLPFKKNYVRNYPARSQTFGATLEHTQGASMTDMAPYNSALGSFALNIVSSDFYECPLWTRTGLRLMYSYLQ